MLRLYLDEDVDVLLSTLLRARGYDCLTTVEAEQLGNTDEQQLAFATAENRILLSHNRVDFEQVATEWWNQNRRHSGVLLVNRRNGPYEQLKHLVAQLDKYAQSEWQDIVLYV